MANTIIKEIIITLLLCLAIILVLGIILYEYVPMAKTIPNPVSYTTPEEAKNELATIENEDEDKIIMTYEINSSDLKNYIKTKDYKPGKANPFSSYQTDEEKTNTTTNTGNSTTTGSQNTSSANNENTTNNNTTTSGGHYFNDKGIK